MSLQKTPGIYRWHSLRLGNYSITWHYQPTHFHRFCSKMSDPQLRCEHFLFPETWYRYDLTWLQQLRKPATKKSIHVSRLLHYPTLWIWFVNQEVLFLKCVFMKLTLSDSTNRRFYIRYSVNSTTKNYLLALFRYKYKRLYNTSLLI